MLYRDAAHIVEKGHGLLKNDIFDTVTAVALAGAGALARILNQKNKKRVKTAKVVSSCFIAMFAGMMVHFLTKSIGIEANLSYVVAGLSGWIGPQVLDAVADYVSRHTGVPLGRSGEKDEKPDDTAADKPDSADNEDESGGDGENEQEGEDG